MVVGKSGRHWKVVTRMLSSREETGRWGRKLGVRPDQKRWWLELGYSWPRNIWILGKHLKAETAGFTHTFYVYQDEGDSQVVAQGTRRMRLSF